MEINGKTGVEEKELSQNTSLSQEKHDCHQHSMLTFPLADTSQIVGLIALLKWRTEGGRELKLKPVPELPTAEEPPPAAGLTKCAGGCVCTR